MNASAVKPNQGQDIVIALSKGRILQQTLPLLAAAGISPLENISESRKLIFPTTLENVKLLAVRPSDAPTYVEYGAADFGIAGKDACRLMVAVKQGQSLPAQHIRVASKYVRSAKNYFAAQGRQVSVIKLYGSMELAPLVGLADCIVDLVDTGKTLQANGLEAVETVCEISSRLIVNRAAFKLKQAQLAPIIQSIEQAAHKGR